MRGERKEERLSVYKVKYTPEFGREDNGFAQVNATHFYQLTLSFLAFIF
jgi:hypothetical protein